MITAEHTATSSKIPGPDPTASTQIKLNGLMPWSRDAKRPRRHSKHVPEDVLKKPLPRESMISAKSGFQINSGVSRDSLRTS